MKPFRIVTYNVHKCKGMDWRVSPARIAEVLGSLDCEVLATQEILLSQAAEISERLELPFTFGTARQHAGEPYGNAVFSSLPVLATRNHDLTVPGREQRQCLRVSFQIPSGKIVHFFTVHLGTSYAERRAQGRALLSPEILLSEETKTQRIITGDFNEWSPDSNPMHRQPDGAWLLQVQLHHGHHQYRFMVDGKPVLDPRANGVARGPRGERVSLIAVS